MFKQMIPILALCVIVALTIGGPAPVEGQDALSQASKVFNEVKDNPCTPENKRKFLGVVNLLLSQWDNLDLFELDGKIDMLKMIPHYPAAKACSQELLKGIDAAYDKNGLDVSFSSF